MAGATAGRGARAQTGAADQTIWYTSDTKTVIPFTALGFESYHCSDHVPLGRANLYPYLTPDGSDVAWPSLSSDTVGVSYNPFATDPSAGTLGVSYASAKGGRLQASFECTSAT